MTSPVTELITALKTHLEGDATLAAAVNGIYSHVPPRASEPYCWLGEPTSKNWRTLESEGLEVMLELNVLTKHRDISECTNIMELIRDRIMSASFSLATHTLIRIHSEKQTIQIAKDHQTIRGTIYVNANIEVSA